MPPVPRALRISARPVAVTSAPHLHVFRARFPPQTTCFHSAIRSQATMASATSFFDFKPKDKKGGEYPLSNLKGKVVLVVNTASKCGFTPQFEGLEKLYKGGHGVVPARATLR